MDLPSRVLVDTNLLVLFVVGQVQPKRIRQFKRTQKYTEQDFQLLDSLLGRVREIYSATHVMAEVSNLTDLKDDERTRALDIVKRLLTKITEPPLASTEAAEEDGYRRLGLTDAAITRLARLHGCTVLTDDFDLYSQLARQEVPVLNFTHLRAAAGLV